MLIHHNETEKRVSLFVSNFTHIPIDEFKARNRKKSIVEAKSLYCYILRSFGWSYPEIASYIKYDHTSVIHLVSLFEQNTALATVEEKLKTEFSDCYPQH